jgi:LPXTG-motif cell wall-anchored protein
MRAVKALNTGLSTSYIATLAVMDGFRARRRTVATAAAVLTVLTLAAPPSVLAQGAGDRQYADPLVTDGGGQSGQQQSPSSQGGNDAAAPEPAPPPAPVPDDSSAVTSDDTASAAAEATLPRTGAEPLSLALAGLGLAACGALGLALPRRARHARR